MEFREIQAKGLERASGAVRCCYVKPSGERCGSPAMRGLDLCYYHDRYQPKPGYRNLPCLEDPHSVQCAIQEIIEDMLNGLLDYKKAALALYGLQTATSNLKQMRIAEDKKMNTERTQGTRRELELVSLSTGDPEEDIRRTKDLCTSHHDDVKEIEPRPGQKPAGVGRKAGAATVHSPATGKRADETSAPTQVCMSEQADETSAPARACIDEPPTTNDRRPTTLVESPRQPQHVIHGLTAAERQRMNEMFPDMKKIRADFLASLTTEERAMIGAPQGQG